MNIKHSVPAAEDTSDPPLRFFILCQDLAVSESKENGTILNRPFLSFQKLKKYFRNVPIILLTFWNVLDILLSDLTTPHKRHERKGITMKVAYIRVSTTHQNTERQEYAMPQDIEKVFSEKISGKNTDRPAFQEMLSFVREGDVVYFESFSRISRSLHDLLEILDTFDKKGVRWVSLKENIDTTGATGKLIISVLGAFSAYEREINAERREYGYRKACEAGTVGRPKNETSEEFIKAYKEWKAGQISAVEAMKKSGLAKTSFYRMVKEYEGR